MFQQFVIFLFGVALLCLGAEWLIRGAATLADAIGIPKHVAGLTLVALGTSAPELFVNLIAAYHQETDFALSNVAGSNLANVCVGFGLCSLVGSVLVRRADFRTDLMFVALVPLVVLGLFYSNANRNLPFWSLWILTVLLAYYFWMLRGRQSSDEENETTSLSLGRGIFFFVIGVAALYFGGDRVLKAAVATAQALGVSEDIIGVTVVAAGTSVPDIWASVAATRQKEYGIAVGNILGSNISNLLLVLNGTILVSGGSLEASDAVRLDYIMVFLTSGFCCLVALAKDSLPRWTAMVLMFSYFAYLTYRVCVVLTT